MRVTDVKKIWDDGEHNAFTDFCRWDAYYWICFRHARNHSADVPGKIFILRSNESGRWGKAADMTEPQADLRDPKWVVRDEKLIVYGFPWKLGIQPRERGPAVPYWTEDGSSWHRHDPDPSMCFRLWRPLKTPDGFYAASHNQVTEDGILRNWVDLMFSRDGFAWEKVSCIASEHFPNETSLEIAPDGTMRALVRREEAGGIPLLCIAKPPYTTWKCYQMDRWLKGPLMRRIDDRLLVVGRCRINDVIRTGLFWLEGTSLRYIDVLPSGKDTSYAGMVQTGDRTALLSYYSGHEFKSGSYRKGQKVQRTAIYLAKLEW